MPHLWVAKHSWVSKNNSTCCRGVGSRVVSSRVVSDKVVSGAVVRSK